MTLDTTLMLAGALVAVLPFLGFPADWNKIFFFILGVLVIVLGIVVRRRYTSRAEGSRTNHAFSENTPPQGDPSFGTSSYDEAR